MPSTRRFWPLPFVFALALLSRAATAQAPRARSVADLEQALRAVPDAPHMEAHHRAMTREPHHAGTPAQRRTAEYYRARLAEWGYDAKLYEYQVYVPYPAEREVTLMTAEGQLPLTLDERPIEGDPDTRVKLDPTSGALPAYNAYSPSGDVTAELVYVNYGRPEDYDTLAKLGVDVKGKIVLARYGQTWRGIKPKVAAERGAAACLIFSDPVDDGFVKGAVYPAGPWRPRGAVQRGSVMDMPRYPGDPTTPGEPSKGNVKRLPIETAPTLAPIPTQPLNYKDAEPLLRALNGPEVPKQWQGGLKIGYRTGPGPGRVHVRLKMDYRLRPIINVIGWLRGSVEPDRWIIAGGHRDAWTFGGRDPISGAASLLETARAFGELAKSGWQPRRTLAFASWDGEDFGLLGSTEWVEEFRDELKMKGVFYINRESYTAGPFSAEASHSLVPLLYSATRDVRDPGDPSRSLYEAWLNPKTEGYRQGRPDGEQTRQSTPEVGALGSGSDYTAFLDFAGVSAMNIGFEGPNGLYHSLYDTGRYFRKYGDPGFKYGIELSRLVGLLMLRASEQPVLPFDHRAYANQILKYVDQIARLGEGKAGFDVVPLASVRDAAAAFGAAGDRANQRGNTLEAGDAPADLEALNHALLQVERDLTDPRGLPDRPWYRHTIYAPGFYTGYAVKTLPGIREAVEAGKMTVAVEQAQRVVEALQRATRTLDGTGAASR